MRLGKSRLDARHVANAEGDRIGIERGVGERQDLGVRLDEIDMRRKAVLFGAVASERVSA